MIAKLGFTTGPLEDIVVRVDLRHLGIISKFSLYLFSYAQPNNFFTEDPISCVPHGIDFCFDTSHSYYFPYKCMSVFYSMYT